MRLYVDMRPHRGSKSGVGHSRRAVGTRPRGDNRRAGRRRPERRPQKWGWSIRSVKPSNILVGELDFAYLIDFGIARAADQSKLTQTGHMIGTWADMAPERLSHGRADSRSDTYSLACVLYECLVGSTPYPGHTVEQQVVGRLTAPPPRPSVTGHVPAAFDGVIAKGMAKDPEDRYPTSYDLALAARSAITSSERVPLPPMPTTERRPRMPTPTPPPISSTGPTQRGSAGGVYPPAGDDVYGRPTAAGQSSHPGSPYVAPYPNTPPPTPYSGCRWPLSTFRSWLWARARQQPPRPAGGIGTAPQRAESRAFEEICATGTRRDCHPHHRVRGHLPILRRRRLGGNTAVRIHRAPQWKLQRRKPPGVFDGTFTASFGPATEFDGAPKVDQPLAQTWSVKQSCGDVGCVATASLVNGQSAANTLVLDLPVGPLAGRGGSPRDQLPQRPG